MENEDLDRILKEAEDDKSAEKPEDKKPEEEQAEKVEEKEDEKEEEEKEDEKEEEKEDEKEEEEKQPEKKEEKLDDCSESTDVVTPDIDNSDLEKDEPVKAVDLKPAEDSPIDRDGEVTPDLDNKDMKEDGDKETEDLQELWSWAKKKLVKKVDDDKTDSARENYLYNVQKKDYEKTDDEKDRIHDYDRRANIEIGNRYNDKEDAKRALKYRDYYADLAYKNAKKRIKDEYHYGLGSRKDRKQKYKEAMYALKTKGKDLVRSEKEQARRDADKYSQDYSSTLGAYTTNRADVKLSKKSYDDVHNDVNKKLDLNKIAMDKDIRAVAAASEAPYKTAPKAPESNAEKPSKKASKPKAAKSKAPAAETKAANADQAQKAQGVAIA